MLSGGSSLYSCSLLVHVTGGHSTRDCLDNSHIATGKKQLLIDWITFTHSQPWDRSNWTGNGAVSVACLKCAFFYGKLGTGISTAITVNDIAYEAQ